MVLDSRSTRRDILHSTPFRPLYRSFRHGQPQPDIRFPRESTGFCSTTILELTDDVGVWYVANVDRSTHGGNEPTALDEERWLSGRKRRFAKPLWGSKPIGGSNPPLSVLSPSEHDNERPNPSFDEVSGVLSSRRRIRFERWVPRGMRTLPIQTLPASASSTRPPGRANVPRRRRAGRSGSAPRQGRRFRWPSCSGRAPGSRLRKARSAPFRSSRPKARHPPRVPGRLATGLRSPPPDSRGSASPPCRASRYRRPRVGS